MKLSIDDIKRLKDLTGVGLTDAKAALTETDGDFDKALAAMRKKGLTKADKRGEREAREGLVGSYLHDNRIGALVELNCETDFVAKNEKFQDLLKDIAMHVAASAPKYVAYNDIPEIDVRAKAEEFTAKAKEQGKPEAMLPNIVDGMLKKHFAALCLLDQPFIKNQDVTVGEVVKEANAQLGENIVVRQFSRVQLGEIS